MLDIKGEEAVVTLTVVLILEHHSTGTVLTSFVAHVLRRNVYGNSLTGSIHEGMTELTALQNL